MIRTNIDTIRSYMKVHIKYIFMISYSNSHFLIISIHVEGLLNSFLKKNVQKIYFLSMRKVIPSLRFRTHAYVYPSNVFCKRKTSKYNATPKTVTISEHTAGSARSINIRSGCALCATPICFKLD